MLIAFGAWLGPSGDRLVMHAWDDACIEELVALLTARFRYGDGIVIDVQRRVADRGYAAAAGEIYTGRAARNAERMVSEAQTAGAWAPGRPPIGDAGRLKPVNRTAARVMRKRGGAK